ncbi:hypothetical protein Lal_00012327 [Lupinus albus]|nr:hypothetical protein Lal_00012269 [Lupinus albus]KAF1872106.1 hypothetical protein Lal_00012327 [Lupinus albus]
MDLDSMSLATLFGKLQEHDMEFGCLKLLEESDKKSKGISLKATISNAKSTNSKKFLRRNEDSESFKEEIQETQPKGARTQKTKSLAMNAGRDIKTKKTYIVWDVPEEERTHEAPHMMMNQPNFD